MAVKKTPTKSRQTRARKSTTSKDSGSKQSQSSESSTKSILGKAVDFYVSQAEKAQPKIEEAVDDYYDYWTNFTEASVKFQKGLLEKVGVKTDFLDKLEGIVNEATNSTKTIHRSVTSDSIQASVKTAKTIKEKIVGKK